MLTTLNARFQVKFRSSEWISFGSLMMMVLLYDNGEASKWTSETNISGLAKSWLIVILVLAGPVAFTG